MRDRGRLDAMMVMVMMTIIAIAMMAMAYRMDRYRMRGAVRVQSGRRRGGADAAAIGAAMIARTGRAAAMSTATGMSAAAGAAAARMTAATTATAGAGSAAGAAATAPCAGGRGKDRAGEDRRGDQQGESFAHHRDLLSSRVTGRGIESCYRKLPADDH